MMNFCEQPDVGTWPWSPVVDREIRKPANNWYEGWESKDWGFLPDIPEELIRMRKFNPGMRYLSGVTADEAAYVVCEFLNFILDFYSCLYIDLTLLLR
jgi:neuroligin